jgi:transposase
MADKKNLNRYGANFELPIILEVVSKAEKGISRQRLCAEYGMGKTTLQEWLNRHGSQHYHANKRARHSPEERRSIVRSIVQGRMTIREAQLQHGIKANDTIRGWLRTFSKETLTPSPAAMKDKKKPTTTESEEIKALKKALAASQLKVAALETMVDIAERELKIDIRKKSGAKQSPK